MSRYAFFRQTGWMLVATGVGGVFMLLVNPILTRPLPFVREPISQPELGLYVALVQFVSILNTWSGGLQSTLAHQTASAITPELERQLRGTVRKLLKALFGVWILALALTLIFQSFLMQRFAIYHPAQLWVTMLIGLPVLWLPVLAGALQGQQNFLWWGWQSILNAMARCLGIFVFVRLIGVHVTGALAGVLAGSATSLAICAWQTQTVLRGPADQVSLKSWLREVTPLVLGLASASLVLGVDMIVVRPFFPDQSGLYNAVAVIGRALMFFIIPMTQVMFPKVVQAAAKSESTDAMTHALGATAFIGAAAALGCTLFPELPLRILFGPEFLPAKTLVWVYAWCMIPVTLANVLINNLMARRHYHAVPWLLALSVGYVAVLVVVASRTQTMEPLQAFRAIVLTFGVFGVLLLAVTIWFTIKKR